MKTPINVYDIAQKLSYIGVLRVTTAQYKALMLSDCVNNKGEFLKIYRGHAIQFVVASKRIGPGVYSISLVDFAGKIAAVDKRMDKCDEHSRN